MIDRKLKDQLGEGSDSSEEEDLENGVKRKQKTGKFWCKYCLIVKEAQTEHCSDCMVCIEEHDHHCVFFSKCIGGGNIYQFYGTIVMVGVNFAILIVSVAFHGLG